MKLEIEVNQSEYNRLKIIVGVNEITDYGGFKYLVIGGAIIRVAPELRT